MALLAAVLMLLLACANYLLHRDPLYPGFLQAFLWFLAVSVLLINQRMFVPVTSSMYILLVAGVTLFSMGAFLGSYQHRPYLMRNQLADGTLPGNRAVAGLSVAVVSGLILYLSRARDLALSGPTSNWFINLRYAVSVNEAETGGFGIAAYFVPLSYLLAAIFVLRRYGLGRPMASRTAVAVTVLIGCVFGVLWAARSTLLPLFVLVLGIPAALRVTRAVKAGAIVAAMTLLLFTVVGLAVGKGGTFSGDITGVSGTLRESFLTYAVGGIPALSTVLDNQGPDLDLGRNTLRSLFAVLRAVGFHTTAAPLVQPWVDVPMPTNVYTVYQPYVQDFGVPGALAAVFLIGFIHSVLYRRATVRNPDAIAVFLFTLSLFPLAMQAFQDMYFSLLSLWIQYTTYAVLFLLVLNERRRKRHALQHAVG